MAQAIEKTELGADKSTNSTAIVIHKCNSLESGSRDG